MFRLLPAVARVLLPAARVSRNVFSNDLVRAATLLEPGPWPRRPLAAHVDLRDQVAQQAQAVQRHAHVQTEIKKGESMKTTVLERPNL